MAEPLFIIFKARDNDEVPVAEFHAPNLAAAERRLFGEPGFGEPDGVYRICLVVAERIVAKSVYGVMREDR